MLIAACLALGGAVAAAALGAELRPVGLAGLGPRARAPRARHHAAAPPGSRCRWRSRRCARAARRARRRPAAGALAGGRARRRAARARRSPSGWRSGSPAAGAAGALRRAWSRRWRSCLTPDWFQFTAHGSEAPLAVALMLWAIERHLDGRRGHALRARHARLPAAPRAGAVPRPLRALAVARRAAAAPAVVGVALRAAAAGLDRAGVDRLGQPARRRRAGAQRAGRGACRCAEQPWLRALERVHNHAGLPLELLAARGGGGGAGARRRSAVLVLAGGGAGRGGAVRGDDPGRLLAATRATCCPRWRCACVLAGVGGRAAARAWAVAAVPGASRRRAGRGRPRRWLRCCCSWRPRFVARARRSGCDGEAQRGGRAHAAPPRPRPRRRAAAAGPRRSAALGPATANRALQTPPGVGARRARWSVTESAHRLPRWSSARRASCSSAACT